MAKQSSVNLDITNNVDGFDISGGTTVRKLGITGGDVTIAGSGSAVVTFPTTSTTIAGLGITQSFSALQSFSAGISAAGGVTLSGTLQGTTANFTGLVSSTVGFSGPGTNITGVVTSFNNQTGAVTGVTVGGTNVFTALNSFNAGISASALTVSGGVTFSGNVYLGDAATGVTAESNDYVMMMGGTGSAAFKSGFYQTYKLLAGSTTGTICVTPEFNANTTRGSTTLEITISYTQLLAGPVNQSSITHKFIMPLLFDQSDSLSVYDYTESITRASSFYSPVTFTFAASSNKIVISTTTAAAGKFTSGWGFRTTVQVH